MYTASILYTCNAEQCLRKNTVKKIGEDVFG